MARVKKAVPRPSRRERAQETRRRIIEAAYRVFCEKGYLATTMEAIATEAGVAVQTLYFIFHTKIAILYEAFDAAVLGLEDTRPPDQREWYQRFAAEDDPRMAVRLLVDNVSEILRRVAPLASVFQTLGSVPDAIERFRQREQLRREGYRRIAKALGTKATLRAGLTQSKAADILYVLLSPDLYQSMVAGCGWSHPEWKQWAAETLLQQLFGR